MRHLPSFQELPEATPAPTLSQPVTSGTSMAAVCERLIDTGRLRRQDLERARQLHDDGEALPFRLIRLGLVSERDVADALADMTGHGLIEARDYPGAPVVEHELSARFLKTARVLPIADDGDTLTLVVADPLDGYGPEAVAVALGGRRLALRIGTPTDIENAIERCHGGGRSDMGRIIDTFGGSEEVVEEDVEHLKDLASEAPVIRLVNLLIQKAVAARASDIHIEPFEDRLKVRYRIDGVLRDVEAPPGRSAAAVISRVKILANLNIAERRLPQDGRIHLRVQGRELDLRVSTVPTLHGESVVLRLLDRESVVLELDALGFDDTQRAAFEQLLKTPNGILLVTGPTGSGKTTTLYTALRLLNTPERKIITVEDPVEYRLEGVNQIPVKPKVGLTFASALRAIVRQDPDVIMIGEMRDLETARIATQSALTGHLVLSTLHTNDAAGGVTRLLDMGVEDYLVTSTVNGILAQRLVRRLCPACRRAEEALPEMVEELGLRRLEAGPYRLWHPVGCEECDGTGYRGRTGIVELLVLNERLRRLILQRADAAQIQQAAIEDGMRTMYDDGMRKALAGDTTVEEVLRVTQDT